MAVTVVITYDISDNRRRTQASHLLQEYGDRIQLSTFLCRLERNDLESLLVRLGRIIDDSEDSVYCFRQCNACWGKVHAGGVSVVPSFPCYYDAW